MKTFCSVERHIPTLCALWHNDAQKKTLNPKEIAQVSKALLSLQRGLTGERALAGEAYMQNSSYLGAYLLYYWPVSYQQVFFGALGNTCLKNAVKQKNVRILDLGCGPAPASAALCDFFSSLGIYAKVTLVDRSSKALSFAERIFKADFPQTPLKTFVQNLESEEKISLEWEKSPYDIIVLGHLVNELWKTKPNALTLRTQFLKHIANLLSKGGILYLLEPATLEASRNAMFLRDYLIEENMHILSPCPNSVHCPALQQGKNASCHAEVDWKPPALVERLAKEAGLTRTCVKMSFFIFQKAENLQKSAVEEKNPPPEQALEATVISDAMKNKASRVRFLLCDGTKRFSFSAKEDDPASLAQGFFSLKRYDKVRIFNADLRNESRASPSYGIGKTTKLCVHQFMPAILQR